jgi:hypothetical protein
VTEVARQAVAETAVDIGNSFTYNVTLDLPIIDAADGIDLTAQFFAVSTSTGVGFD